MNCEVRLQEGSIDASKRNVDTYTKIAGERHKTHLKKNQAAAALSSSTSIYSRNAWVNIQHRYYLVG